MMGMKFEDCNDFLMDFSFMDCTLNYTSFYGLDLKNIQVIDCKLVATDFTDCNLSRSKFDNCDLDKAIFVNTDLSNANMSTSYHITMDPEQNKLKHAHFSMASLPGLLAKHKIKVIS
jgi:uncharacterized protein YjbI with pentapeptide repeats